MASENRAEAKPTSAMLRSDYVNTRPTPPGWEKGEWDEQCYIADVTLAWDAPAPPRQRDVMDVRTPRNRPERKGWIYFIGSDEGPVKVGFTANVSQRLKRLSASSPVPLKVLAKFQGTASDERYLHLMNSRHRLHGEWFARCPDILAEIERLAA